MVIHRISAEYYKALLNEIDKIDQRARRGGWWHWYTEFEEERLDYIGNIFESFLMYDDVPHMRLQEKALIKKSPCR